MENKIKVVIKTYNDIRFEALNAGRVGEGSHDV